MCFIHHFFNYNNHTKNIKKTKRRCEEMSKIKHQSDINQKLFQDAFYDFFGIIPTKKNNNFYTYHAFV